MTSHWLSSPQIVESNPDSKFDFHSRNPEICDSDLIPNRARSRLSRALRRKVDEIQIEKSISKPQQITWTPRYIEKTKKMQEIDRTTENGNLGRFPMQFCSCDLRRNPEAGAAHLLIPSDWIFASVDRVRAGREDQNYHPIRKMSNRSRERGRPRPSDPRPGAWAAIFGGADREDGEEQNRMVSWPRNGMHFLPLVWWVRPLNGPEVVLQQECVLVPSQQSTQKESSFLSITKVNKEKGGTGCGRNRIL